MTLINYIEHKFYHRITLYLIIVGIFPFMFCCQSSAQTEKIDDQEFIVIDNLADFTKYISQDEVKVRLVPGNYQIDEATSIRFIQITGNNAHFDLTGCRFMVDTQLFSRTDLAKSDDGNSLYCAIEISGHDVTLEGLYIETYGGQPGRQSKNKLFNIVGENVTLKNVEVRTAGSRPWGYGSLYGIGGGSGVRKMNGIRVGYPAKNVQLIGCKVHMRAMGHAIFLQGAENTLIEDCHVDGLLRTTNQILAETSGYCYEKNFYAGKGGYIEGTTVADDGKILPGEMISLSEDGIRMYPEYKGHLTTNTTIKNCTVFQMRRGICTGLSKSGDKVINCQVRNCVAAGFNVGNEDTLINCSSDAKYAEAFCVPYLNAKNAYVEMEILDSRNGIANNLLAAINGKGHHVMIKTTNPSFIPESFAIELSTRKGYAFYQRSGISASDIKLENKTETKVVLLPGTENAEVKSNGPVVRNTSVSIQGDKFLINGVPTYLGRTWKGYPVEGLLMNSRMVQGIFDDLNPETSSRWNYEDTRKWDANRNTNEFVQAMDSWYEKGLLAFTINLQGGSPLGYGNKGWINSAYDEAGILRPEYMNRLEKILDKADEIGMVAILGLFYNDQEDLLKDEAAVLNGVDNVIRWLSEHHYSNVIIEINNECNLKYRHEILQPQRVHEVMERIKLKAKNGYRYLVGTSFSGGKIPTENVVKAADFILVHGNGVHDPAQIPEMVKRTKQVEGYTPKPILFNEDDHFDFDQPSNNMEEAVKAFASWGYFDYRMKGEGYENGFQSVPVNWEISSPRKKAFFNKLNEITGGDNKTKK